MGCRAAGAASAGAAVGRTAVTTARCGAASAGRSAAATAFAPDLERWKNRGRTSSRFSGVRTFASSTTLVMQSRPLPPVAQRVDDLRESLDELRGGLPVERRPAREPELPVQEVEERGVPELDPEPLAVEVGEGDEKFGERCALAMEELGEAGGEIACGGHDASIARDFGGSPGARIRVRDRERERALENPLAHLQCTGGEFCGAGSGIPARSLAAEVI